MRPAEQQTPSMGAVIFNLIQLWCENVIGVVIGKTDVRSFPDRKNIGSERYTFTFTIRDSPTYFINVNPWGREEYIRSLSESFRVGDCVTIENPLIQSKEVEREEKFNPVTPR
ncbi:hypothetical protein llap_15166 [Limosa lapponica baueri]|uniref:MEIOB-like N-terminal domain-containing protein n=1 Tax=Limosa lapponica baueri TaxID=1758121 RepID=A0A2I0TL34_LIMLA|nr:hypothetical protein llap_15166 [Limosa lapponica baueri]